MNADQTVIILWDAAEKTQHFIRQASFKSEGDDFGFIVPSPSQPTLAESGNEAFSYLRKLTEPEIIKVKRDSGIGCGCSKSSVGAASEKKDEKKDEKRDSVTVLDRQQVAGYDAAVLEATSGDVLVDWLKQNGYAYSPEVAAWAKPYIEQKWKFTALKVAKKEGEKEEQNVETPALRLTFKTDRPLFPYREPDNVAAAKELGVSSRLLRIYFLSDGRYDGDLTKEKSWARKVPWANELTDANRTRALELLQLPAETAPGTWWLTEIEHRWPYAVAPGDVYFARDKEQHSVKREPIIQYVNSPVSSDTVLVALVGIAAVPWFWRRRRLHRAQP